MITTVLVFIAAALLVTLISVPVFLWRRWQQNERRRRVEQLDSVYRSQMHRRRGDRQ
jgi:hypothetical protein